MRNIVKAFLVLTLSAPAYGQLVWSDEFNGPLDSATWSFDLGAGGWGNSELQEYTSDPANVRVENGQLVITAVEQVLKGNRKKYTSARVKTEQKVTFRYGTLEARIKVPDLADGLWPAFWTLGNNFSEVGWPDSGELDVMEMGSAGAIADAVVNRRVGSTAHWEHNNSHAAYGLTYDSATDLNNDFHVFRMEWTPDLVSTYIDNQWIWSIDITPGSCTDCTEFHEHHFVILNLAVGGSFTGLYRASDITAPMPAEMLIDYVRIYDNGFTELGGSAIGGGNGGSDMHVASITPGSTGGGPNKRATAEIHISDETGADVEGATVTATFSGSHNETVSSVTGPDGRATLTTSSRSGTVAFNVCVDDVSHGSLTYVPGSNLETCDSF